ncbi:MAG: PAS domain-containing protein, partial [Eubacteriaceae bacterium]|nr:PAS domain-containing protein [Eubacteriaceae bacterium]
LLKLTGWSLPFPKEKLKEALSLEKCIVPADQGKFKTNVLEKAKEGQSINASFRFYDANHHAIWLHMSAKKLREEKGQAVYYAIFIHPSTEATLYREIIENSDNNIALITADDEQIIFANKCFWSLVGYDQPLTEPISLLDALKLKKICNISELLRDVPDGQFYESPVIASDQGRHYIFRCKRMLWNDIPAVILYIRDETKNEKHLSELRRLLDRLPGGVGIFECDHERITLSYLNDGYYRLLGDTRENRERFIKHTFFDAVHPDDLPQVLKKAQSMMDGSPHTDLTYRIFGKDKIVWMRIVADMYHDKNGRRIIYCSFSNMDNQMAREIDLKSSKALAEACMKDTKTCAWEFYPKSGRAIMTENAQKLYGLPSILEKMPESLIQDKRIHPDTRDAYRIIFSGQFSEGSPITREIALRSADQKYWCWTRCTAAPIYNDQGDLVKVIGTSMDITDQKNMEDQYHKMLHDLDIANDKNLIAKSRYNLNTTKMEYFQRITEDAIPQSAYRYDDALHATVDTVLGESYRKEMLKTLDRDHLIQAFKNGQNEFNLEYRRKGNDGTVFWASTAVKTFVEPNNGDLMVFIYTRDISEARTAREIIDTVVANDYDYMALLNCKTECYSIYARNDKKTSLPPFHSSNYEKEVEAYARQYVVPEDISKNIHDMSLANLRRQLKSADSFTSYCSLKNKQGEIQRKKLQFICLDRENERVLITRTDVTDLYEKEQRQIHQLKSARDAAETANQTKTEFLSRMSHDLRTPMNVVIGLASLALDEVNNPQAMEEALTNITNSGRYLLGLVNDCLDLEKITSGKMELHPKPYYYNDFCNNIRSIIDPLCQGKDVTFVLDTQSNPMPLIVVDRLRMEQIFFNLLSNAVKFTPSDGTVEMLTQNICIHNNQASFDSIVRDNGIGMSQAFQDHMFEPFVQESAPIDVQNQGTGLGLSIVKQLTQLMGATLDVKSKQGTGTTFTIHWTLPLAHPETCPDHVKPQPETQILSGKRVLLAEDHPLNAMIAKKMLEKVGIFVITTQNGQEALDAFKSVVPNYFDAILMDIRMPVMDGLKATRAIRALDRPDAGTIPIIAMTANAFDSDKAETQRAGMNTHLTKPIEPPILYATLARLIQ